MVNFLRAIPALLFAVYLWYQASRFLRVWVFVITDNDYERGRPGWLREAVMFNIRMFPLFVIAFGLAFLGLAFTAYALIPLTSEAGALGRLLRTFIHGLGIGVS